jgi:D-glycero-alpha-D-manno-heptose 1-phosphate guanylyltransferase
MMEAIILAGGLGTRLRAVNPDAPKPMALIGSRPFLEVLIRSLASKGFKRIILSLGYKAEMIRAHFGSSYSGVDIVYVVEEVPLGTGGAIRLAMTKSISDHVYIFNGDTFLDVDIKSLEERWQEDKNPIIVGYSLDNVERYGKLIIDKNHVIGFSEKGSVDAGIINAGCYIFNRNQLSQFPVNQKFSLEIDYLSEAISHTTFDLFIASGTFIDIGIPDDFFRAQNLLQDY